MKSPITALLGLLALSATLTACPPAVTTGTLEIAITGNPAGTTPSITITGPSNFTQTISATTTIPNLEPGSYAINTPTLAVNNAEYTSSITGSPVTVTANQTATVSVGFTLSVEPFVFPANWSINTPAEAKTGGVYRRAYLSDFDTLNPFLSAQSDSLPTNLSPSGGLFILDPTTRDYIPYMAKSFTTSSDGLIWTFQLRKGMKWSDGQAITADDWVTTAKIHRDVAVGSNSYDSLFGGNAGFKVEKVDAMTLKITFPNVIATAIETFNFTPYPDHVFAPIYASGGAIAIKATWGVTEDLSKIVTAGAFKLKSYTVGQNAILERNAFFGEWNRDTASKPLPYLAQYRRIKGDSFDLFQASQVDSVNPTGTQISTLETAIQNNSLQAVLKKNYGAAASSQWIVFNFNRASDLEKQRLFRDDAFRQAMSHLANRARMVTEVYAGAAAPTYTSVYAAFPDWVSSTAPKFDFNLQAAKTLLAGLGYSQTNTDGYLTDGTGKVLEFNLATNSGNAQREQIAAIFADEAKNAGVKVNVLKLDFNTLVNNQLLTTGADRPFDAILLGLNSGSLSYPLGGNILQCKANLHSFNTSGACLFSWETELENKFVQGNLELDRTKRIVIAKQAQDLEAAHQPFVYLVSPLVSTAWRSSIKGEYPTSVLNSVVGTRALELTWVQP